jgi:hypothetical protein
MQRCIVRAFADVGVTCRQRGATCFHIAPCSMDIARRMAQLQVVVGDCTRWDVS